MLWLKTKEYLNTFQHSIYKHATTLPKQTWSYLWESLPGIFPVFVWNRHKKTSIPWSSLGVSHQSPKRFSSTGFSYLYSTVFNAYGLNLDIDVLSILSKYSHLNFLLIYPDEGYPLPQKNQNEQLLWKLLYCISSSFQMSTDALRSWHLTIQHHKCRKAPCCFLDNF